jgi:hypothetical protein
MKTITSGVAIAALLALLALLVATPAWAKPGDCLKWLNVLSDQANTDVQFAESNARAAAMTGVALDPPDSWVDRERAASNMIRKTRDACLEELSR